MEDVCSEVNNFFKKKFRDFQLFTKPVNRKYGFELPDIPTEARYLKVTYPFTRMLFLIHMKFLDSKLQFYLFILRYY
jgi:hypothetical protein